MSKVAVVGAGASGLMVAGFLAQDGHDVTVFDGNEKVGKKLYITGKGRCNLTNLCPPDEFLKNVVRGEKFLRSAIYNFTSEDAVDFFESLGLKTKVERGNRVFPESDKSSDVIKVLRDKHCKNVKFVMGCKVEKIEKSDGCFVVSNRDSHWLFDKVIVATGGKSYQATGSDGDGYKFAKSFGHNIIELKGALCPIKLKDTFVKSLQGVSLKNVQLDVFIGASANENKSKNKGDGKRMSFFGEMLFTDAGISGPIVLTASSFVNRAEKGNVKLTLDFKPALSEKQLDSRLLRDFESAKNSELKSVLRGLLPKAVAEVFAKVSGLDAMKKVNSVTKEEREKIVWFLKNFPLTFDGLYDMDAAIVTSGGVDLGSINPKTFESKLQSGLYFLGEVLDVDALTGGFNLQCCWATAKSCADNFLLPQKCQKGAS